MKILFLGKMPRKSESVDNIAIKKRFERYVSPGTTIDHDFPDNYDGSLAEKVLGKQKMLNGLDHAMVTPPIIRKIVWAAENGYDAVVESNTFDPGVEVARLTVPIPVIGVFKTALHFGTMLADRIGMVVPLDSHIPYTWRILRTYGMDGFVTGIRSLGMYGDDLAEHIPEIFDKTAGLIRGLVTDTHAQMILPLGGALIPYLVDPADLAKETGVPVLNTTPIALRFAETCVALGLSQSPLAYPRGKLSLTDLVERV